MDSRTFISCVILVVIPALASAKTCPEKYRKITPEHSFCKDPNPECKVEKQGVSEDDIKIILEKHNEIRNKVAIGEGTGGLPEASGMREIEWDEELAAIAQSWALQCISNHDCNECRKVERFNVGQNFAGSSCATKGGCKPGWSDSVDLWINEQGSVNRDLIKSYRPDPDTGHFAQMIWDTTFKVGCGYVEQKSGDTFEKYQFCNYGPAGNIPGVPVYEEGTHCSKCPSGTSCSNTYPGLCKSGGKEEEDYIDGGYEYEDLSDEYDEY